ncbi:MAG: clostripain-related cysteine peptidase [Candidatus Heimdallarchaeota archaeon]
MNFKKYIPLVIIILLTSFAVLPKISIKGHITPEIKNNYTKEANKDWTVMLYFCADTRSVTVTSSIDNSGNFLHAEMTAAKQGIYTSDLLPGSESNINVIALYDYPYTPTDHDGHAVIYNLRTLTGGGVETVADWGPTNMGDPQTLNDFVDFCKTNYPADNYALTLSDHGRGYAGFCFDYHAPHPYMPYAIGDCLQVPELESALSGSNSVDLLMLDTCLGGSFEVAWQLVGEVSYIVAGETTQGGSALLHQREVIYNLSRDTTMTPLELAQVAYDTAENPQVLPSYTNWGSVSLIDLTRFPVAGLGLSFMDTFDLFTDKLVDEINYNTSKIQFFKELRNNLETQALHSATSMMVDLYDFIEAIVANQTEMHYVETSAYASDLLLKLNPTTNGVLVDEYHLWAEADYLHGFSICFPDTYDMYQGYLYPGMYDALKISTETSWGAFIFKLYQLFEFERYHLHDYYEIQLFIIDPTIRLDVYYDPLESPKDSFHIGLNNNFPDTHMGIELGTQGAEYQDDLIGNFMIRIPTPSFQMSKANGAEVFKVVVNATTALSATQDVNLTVKHITDDVVVWQETKLHDIEVGQALTTEISTDDDMSDFVVTEIPPTNNIGYTNTSNIVVISIVSFVVILMVVYRRKKKFE